MSIAILMAAGFGSRMRPMTDNTPKPLICVGERPMIETLIEGLRRNQVGKIYIVVGYLAAQFEYLRNKYEDITLIENKQFSYKNNISSIYAARDELGKDDCFICEADLYLREPGLLDCGCKRSGYFGRLVGGWSDDWVFETEQGRIVRVKKGGENRYNMIGLSYFKKADAAILKTAIERACGEAGHEELFWDEVVDKNIELFDLCVYPVGENSIFEIDTADELLNVESKLKILADAESRRNNSELL